MTIRIVFFLLSLNVYSQSDVGSLYAHFDKTIGVENLPYNNGTVHVNQHISFDKTHRYFGTSDFQPGTLIYEGQTYDNVSFKYDLLDDGLVIKMAGEGNNMGFDLINRNVDAFNLAGRKFVNAQILNPPHEGFYEEVASGSPITLLVKHRKERIEVLTNRQVLNKFVEKSAFGLKYNGRFHRADSKRDIIAAFPSLSGETEAFYINYETLRSSNERLFMINLVTHLNSIIAK